MGVFLEQDCRDEEGESRKNESGEEAHFHKQ